MDVSPVSAALNAFLPFNFFSLYLGQAPLCGDETRRGHCRRKFCKGLKGSSPVPYKHHMNKRLQDIAITISKELRDSSPWGKRAYDIRGTQGQNEFIIDEPANDLSEVN